VIERWVITVALSIFKRKPRNEDEQLLFRVVEGDEEALAEFYDRFFSRLYRYIYYRVGRDHMHTEEVVHDTLMEALDKADRYDPERGTLERWLVTLSRNRIRSSNNGVGKAKQYEQSWGMVDSELEQFFESLEQGELPEEALEREEVKDLVSSTMSTLPADYAKLLEMKYMRDMTVKSMASLLEKTEKAVESQLMRARAAFREAFAALAQEGLGGLGSLGT
jgi:RNA polymerase sigma-70 factor, ECF subfamily